MAPYLSPNRCGMALCFAVAGVAAYIPALATNDSVSVLKAGLALKWTDGSGGDYSSGVSYQLAGNGSLGTSAVSLQPPHFLLS